MAANANGVASIKRCVELCYNLAVDSYAMSLQYGFGLRAAFANGFEQILKQWRRLGAVESVQSTVGVVSLYI